MCFAIEMCNMMVLAEKEGNDDEVIIDEDNVVGTDNNNNEVADELDFNINESIVQKEEQVK